MSGSGGERTKAPGSRVQPAAWLQISPFLVKMPPFQEPPMVNTRPSDSSVLACKTVTRARRPCVTAAQVHRCMWRAGLRPLLSVVC